jgi:DNA-binding PadR family transcriptional regulator
MHGYELITELEARSSGRWRPSPGSIYPALTRMEEQGLITADEFDEKKVFSLTEGLSWRQGENRTRTEFDLTPWRGARGGAGRGVPQGFPRSNRFG